MYIRPAWVPTDSECQEARAIASNGLTVAQIAEASSDEPQYLPRWF